MTSHAGFGSEFIRIDDIEFDMFFCQKVLHTVWHGFEELFIAHVRIE